MSLITGTCFVRDTGEVHNNKRLFLYVGQIWVPASIALKPEHKYILVGSEYHTGDAELASVGLQLILNSATDISNETRKKHPSQIISLLHTPHP